MTIRTNRFYQMNMLLRRRPIAWAYASAYLVFLLSCTRVWIVDPTLLYLFRDSDFSLWLGKAYLDWAYPLSVTTINPFQDMGSMLVAVNPYFNPAAWIFQTDLGLPVKFVISMVAYCLEVTLSTYLLGRALGFSKAFSFAASLWTVFLFFPPFNFIFGLQGILGTSPPWGTMLTLSNMILVVLLSIGNPLWAKRGLIHATVVNGTLATVMTLLVLICLVGAPFYAAATLLGTVLLCAVIVLSSANISQALWRAGAGIYSLMVFYALGVPTFFEASKTFSARFAGSGSGDTSLPQIHWPIDLSHTALASAQQWLCDAAVVCQRLPFPGSLTGAYWLHAATVAGAVAVWLCMPRPLSRVGLWFAILWILLLLFWIACSLGLISNVAISPIYIVVAMHPFWAFFSTFALRQTLNWVALGLGNLMPKATAPRIARSIPFALPAIFIVLSSTFAWRFGNALASGAPLSPYYPSRGAFDIRKTDKIIDKLREEIALRPGEPFRGAVATVLGARGGSLRKALGLPADKPLAPGQYELFLTKLVHATGNDHLLFDMWWLNLPTLSEYAQGISRQFMFYLTNFLSEPDDLVEVDIAFPRRANIDVLGAMGVRFVIIDKPLSNSRLMLRVEEPIGDAQLYLYEIANPNLGTYSPTRPVQQTELDRFRTDVNEDPAVLASRAFVQSPIVGTLVPASDAHMTFERDGVRVVATSSGTSLLLLPVQYSHCLHVDAPDVSISRANLIFTLVRFSNTVNTKLDWKFNFWRQSECRRRDVADMRALGLVH